MVPISKSVNHNNHIKLILNMNPLPLQDSTHHNKLVQGRRRKAAVGMNLGEERKPDARKAARRWSTAAVGLGPLDVGEDGEREKERERVKTEHVRGGAPAPVLRGRVEPREQTRPMKPSYVRWSGVSLSLSLSLPVARSLSFSVRWRRNLAVYDGPTNQHCPTATGGRRVAEKR